MNNYYPFGLTFNSYKRVTAKENKYNTFQDQEKITALDLNWIQFKWRNHDPAIGRFFNVDPIAEDYYYNSPYAFSENAVISYRELEGLEKVITIYSPMLTEELEKARKIEDLGQRAAETERIVDYALNNGFVDDEGNESDYMLRKLKENNINELDDSNTASAKEYIIGDDMDQVIYNGVEIDENGKVIIKNIDSKSVSGEFEEYMDQKIQEFFENLFLDEFNPFPIDPFLPPTPPPFEPPISENAPEQDEQPKNEKEKEKS